VEPLRVALAQTDVILGSPEANRVRLPEWAERAAAAGARLLLLPELWNVGYAQERWATLGASLTDGAGDDLALAARQFGLYVVASVLERHGDALHNTAVLFSPEGDLLGTYRKAHLVPLFEEDRYLRAGQSLTFLDLPWGRVGLAVCYDLRFPELFRAYALGGAVGVLLVAEWPQDRIEHWSVLVQARAIENEFFVVACNRVGQDESGEFGGRSMVVGPWGEVLVEGVAAEALLVADIDVSQVRLTRDRLPVLNDRRPDLYGALVER